MWEWKLEKRSQIESPNKKRPFFLAGTSEPFPIEDSKVC